MITGAAHRGIYHRYVLEDCVIQRDVAATGEAVRECRWSVDTGGVHRVAISNNVHFRLRGFASRTNLNSAASEHGGQGYLTQLWSYSIHFNILIKTIRMKMMLILEYCSYHIEWSIRNTYSVL